MKLSREDIEREVDYVRRCFGTDEFVPTESVAGIEARCADLKRDFELMASAVQPLRPGECAIITLTRRKTAALLVDRVWAADTTADLSINFGWELPMEVRFRALLKLHDVFERSRSAPSVLPASPSELDSFLVAVEHDLALGFAEASGLAVAPLYSLASRRDAQYRGGDQAAVVCIIDNLGIIDEERLSWAQVVEFRRDEAARKAYKQFVHWLDREMIDKPVPYVTDELGQRLERYNWSLQKHGIQTLIGSISSTLNPRALVSSTTAGVAVNIIAGKPLWSLLAAGGLLLGHAALSVATALVARRDIDMAYPEISYVQQLSRDAGRVEKVG